MSASKKDIHGLPERKLTRFEREYHLRYPWYIQAYERLDQRPAYEPPAKIGTGKKARRADR